MRKQSPSSEQHRFERALEERGNWQEAYKELNGSERIVCALALGAAMNGCHDAGPAPEASSLDYWNPAVTMQALEHTPEDAWSPQGLENARQAWSKLAHYFEGLGVRLHPEDELVAEPRPLSREERFEKLGAYLERNAGQLSKSQLERVGRELRELSGQEEGEMSGSLRVLLVRLERLKRSITARTWEQVERQYDRVLRAAQKLERQREREPAR